jgi:hypothetical protein
VTPLTGPQAKVGLNLNDAQMDKALLEIDEVGPEGYYMSQ